MQEKEIRHRNRGFYKRANFKEERKKDMCSCEEWTTSVLTEKESKDVDDSEVVPFWFCGVKFSLRAKTGNCGDKNMESVHMNYVPQSKDVRKRFDRGNFL